MSKPPRPLVPPKRATLQDSLTIKMAHPLVQELDDYCRFLDSSRPADQTGRTDRGHVITQALARLFQHDRAWRAHRNSPASSLLQPSPESAGGGALNAPSPAPVTSQAINA